jgi:hypothetical protein
MKARRRRGHYRSLVASVDRFHIIVCRSVTHRTYTWSNSSAPVWIAWRPLAQLFVRREAFLHPARRSAGLRYIAKREIARAKLPYTVSRHPRAKEESRTWRYQDLS